MGFESVPNMYILFSCLRLLFFFFCPSIAGVSYSFYFFAILFERPFTTDFKDETKQRKGGRGRKAGTMLDWDNQNQSLFFVLRVFFISFLPIPFRNYVFLLFFLLLFSFGVR